MNGKLVKTIACMIFVGAGATTIAATFDSGLANANPYALQLVNEGWTVEASDVEGDTVRIEAEKDGEGRILQVSSVSGFVYFDSLEDDK